MKIAIFGTGYVGLSNAILLAQHNEVVAVDIVEEKVLKINSKQSPIKDKEIEDFLQNKNLNLLATLDPKIACNQVDLVIISTPTDYDPKTNFFNTSSIEAVLETLDQLKCPAPVVIKSTVPVGTANKVKVAIQEELNKRGVDVPFDVASNPEFLKEGAAIKDFMSPDRVVVGIESNRAEEVMTKLYQPFLLQNFRVIFMDIPSAEMTKYAANAMLATRISFMNDIANLCELVGANVHNVRRGIGTDTRIGAKFLYAGCGYGGSCFPKDVKALVHTGMDVGYRMKVIEAVEEVNEYQKGIVFEKLLKMMPEDESLQGKTIAVLGLAFKPETDDMREAPALVVIDCLLKAGAKVRVFDPIAMVECKRRIGDLVAYADNIYDCVDGAYAMLLMTEWRQFRLPSWNVIKKIMIGNIIVDGRNIYHRDELEAEGFSYITIGE